MIKLRDYQQNAVSAVFDAWRDHDDVLIVMATGTGKTETLLGVLARAKQETAGFRALIMAHRDELIHQPTNRIERGWRDRLPVPGIVMGSTNEPDRQIVVATVQTLAGKSADDMRRLDEVLSHGAFTHFVIDEAHHATAETYRRVIARLKEANSALKHLGVTATPKRSDDNGLKLVYSHVAYRLTIKDAIDKLGCLVPFMALGFTLPVETRSAIMRNGQYSDGKLDKLLTAANVEEIIIEKWKGNAAKIPTIIFTAGVQQAHSLARAFCAAGVSAIAADGTTSREERRRILVEFSAGHYQVIVNCALWTEGMDAPSIGCVVNAAPTKSDLVYIQRIGRGLRPHPSKERCLILDFAPLDDRDIVMAGDLLGVPREQKKAVTKAAEDAVIMDFFGFKQKAQGIDAEPDALVVKVLDFFTKKTNLSWVHDGIVATATVKADETICIVFPQYERLATAEVMRQAGRLTPAQEAAADRLERFQLFVVRQRELIELDTFDDWQDATNAAEAYADIHMDTTLAKRSRPWKIQPASNKQMEFAKRLGVWSDGMGKGEVAKAITHKLARNMLVKIKVVLKV